MKTKQKRESVLLKWLGLVDAGTPTITPLKIEYQPPPPDPVVTLLRSIDDRLRNLESCIRNTRSTTTKARNPSYTESARF